MTDFSDKIIITDLDETFFGDHAALVQRNLDAIERFKAGGGFFTISTGRIHTNLRKPIPMVETLVNAPISCCNGALIYDIRNGTTLSERLLDHGKVKDIINFLHANFTDFFIRVSMPDGFLITPYDYEHSEDLRRDVKSGDAKSFVLADLDEWDKYKLYKIVVRGEAELLDEMRAALVRRGCYGVELSKSAPKFFEVQGEGTNKGCAIPFIRRWCSEKSGKTMKVYACGDFENDLPMLKVADCAVCPSNALDSVKQVSKYVLCDHSDGLIADLIERIEREEIQ